MARKDDILHRAMTLPGKQRAILTEELWLSLDDMTQEQIDHAWLKELKRRWAAYERGDIQAVSGQVALREARQRLRKRRQRPA